MTYRREPEGFSGPSLACNRCGSTTLGGSCSGGCGEMRCACDNTPCPTCKQQEEYDEDQDRYEAELIEREDFENEMGRKYR